MFKFMFKFRSYDFNSYVFDAYSLVFRFRVLSLESGIFTCVQA